jgi:hypothetical protein
MKGSAGIMLNQGAKSGRISDKAFSGRLRPATQHK